MPPDSVTPPLVESATMQGEAAGWAVAADIAAVVSVRPAPMTGASRSVAFPLIVTWTAVWEALEGLVVSETATPVLLTPLRAATLWAAVVAFWSAVAEVAPV